MNTEYLISDYDYGIGNPKFPLIQEHRIPGVADGSVAVALCDPPYNIGKAYADDPTGDYLKPEVYRQLMGSALVAAREALRPGGVCFVWCNADQFQLFAELKDCCAFELLWDTPIIWWERFSQYQKKRMTQDFRFIFPMRKPGPPTPFYGEDILVESERMRLGDKRAAGSKGKVPGRVWVDGDERQNAVDIFAEMVSSMSEDEVAQATRAMLQPRSGFASEELPAMGRVWKDRRLQGTSKDRVDWHPMQLPPEQIERIIKGFSRKGDTVLDNFAGSGSSAESALNLGRNFIGVDKSPTYRSKIERRIEQRCPNARKVELSS